jgi:DNA topoisomerase II
MSMIKEMGVENKSNSKYKKLTQREHVLLRKNMYCGDPSTQELDLYVVDDIDIKDNNNIKISKRKIKYNAAFIKLFDETISNASDAAIRYKNVSYIKVSIDKENGTISVENDCIGGGIPVEINKEEGVYIPEMIFSHFLTGENYDDNEERFLSGQNGLGIKLVNVLSTEFKIEVADGKKLYKQKFTDNLGKTHPYKITDTDKCYVKVTYQPDFKQFNELDSITDDSIALMVKRVVDLSVYNPNVKFTVNGKMIKVKSIKDWMRSHTDEESELYIDDSNSEWVYGVIKSPTEQFESVSVVSSVSCYRGGTHINYLSLNLSKAIADNFPKKIKATWADVKNKIMLFVTCRIPNPSFDSQTKEYLTNQITKDVLKDFQISDKFIKKIMKSEIVKSIIEALELKEQQELLKLSKNAKKTSKISIENLSDANKAGTSESEKCVLFLSEGLSAKTMAISGMSVVGRDYYGVFPLKGKVLNVRDAAISKIKTNDEIQNIVNILGLEFGKKYEDLSTLRYGKIVFMTDADIDGIHIKGLLINLFHTFWPELLKMNFIYEFITPIVKAKQKSKSISFYTNKDYKDWLSKNDSSRWEIKYYKGLGTSTAQEAREYFTELDKHLLPFIWDSNKNDDYIDLVFNKEKADDRKNWILTNKLKTVDKYSNPTNISSFINNELIEFSIADNIRSIPSIYDGLKPSQRKILFTCFKRNITSDIKVATLSGSVQETSAYHHGLISLEQSIVNLAQNYTGTNNINLLVPSGQFGTRISGGKDASSARYIFTRLNDITRLIYKKEDESILSWLEDDGQKIEPKYYLPIIPMILINGAEGIGSGWSTYIPQHNPLDVIKNIELLLDGKKQKEISPWYKGFEGKIIKKEDGNYYTYGKCNKINTTKLHISELPVGFWIDNFKNHLDKLIEDKFIKDYNDNSSEQHVDITINLSRETMESLNEMDIISKFKLETKLSLSNMHMFVDDIIIKYDSSVSIIKDFYVKKLKHYEERKQYVLNKLEYESVKLKNIINFLTSIIKEELIINNRKKDVVINDLEKMNFMKIEDSYNYLLNMSIFSFTKEKVEEYKNNLKEKLVEIKSLKNTDIKDLWRSDLNLLKSEFTKFLKNDSKK